MDEKDVEYTKALNPHSVTLKMSAKGETTWEVKVYGEYPEESKEQALRIHKELCVEYNK